MLTLFVAHIVMAQSYYNEWIDFSKTYYRCQVGATGIYRITLSDLNTIGLGGEAAQNFQLWRNGKEVPLYTSVASGPLGASDYIEFWGERNDGVTDRDLYRLPSYQLNDQESLLTDTAAFFLTVNSASANLRYAATANNVAGNTLPPEPYFIYSLRKNFKDRIHPGWAENYGERVYSSSYDIGEMWSSFDIDPKILPSGNNPGSPGTPLSYTFADSLHTASGGPAAVFSIGIVGSASSTRDYSVTLNNSSILTATLSTYNARINSTNVTLSQLPGC